MVPSGDWEALKVIVLSCHNDGDDGGNFGTVQLRRCYGTLDGFSTT
jgi:hypothetical protein